MLAYIAYMDPSWVILQDRMLDGEPNSRTPANTEFTKSGASRQRNGAQLRTKIHSYGPKYQL